MTSTIASGAGIAVGGNSPASRIVEKVMRTEILIGSVRDDDPAELRARMLEARFQSKPPERR